MGEMVMMTVQGWQCPPSIEQVAKQLLVAPSAIDWHFGVILVDPERKIYTVRVDKSQIPEGEPQAKGVSGPFSDPKIAPFGPPEPADK